MHASTLHGVLEHLRKLTDPARSRDVSDADLLDRFRLSREEAAFTLLVQRHGPMVLSVCRRILDDAHEAEDAFQATFLVLVRKAATIRKQQSLASWLHGVASRIAQKARLSSLRQKMQEAKALPSRVSDDPSVVLFVRELRTALDEEIKRLPAKYRTPLVLCYLTDKSHEQAAQELGWSKSTVSARLAKARQLLQQRLIRRGFSAPAGLLAALFTEQTATAAVPYFLTLSTVRLAVQVLKGETLSATTVAVLAGSCAGRVVVSKWTAALFLLATIGTASTISYRLTGADSPSKQPEAGPREQAEGEAKSARSEPSKSRTGRLSDPVPDELLARIGSGRMRHGGYVRALSFSPDGKSIVSGGVGSLCIWDTTTGKRRQRFQFNTDWNLAFPVTAVGIAVASADKKGIVTVQLFDPASGKLLRSVEMKGRATLATLSFSPDGKQLAFGQDNTARLCDPATGKEILRISNVKRAVDIAFAPDGKTIALSDFTHTIPLYDTATGKRVRLLKRYFDNVHSSVFSPDGRLLASISNSIKREEEPSNISILDVKTGSKRHRLKAPGRVFCAAFSSDGRYLAMGGNRLEVILWDVATGKEVRRYPSESNVGSIVFSPDGKRLVAASTNGAIRLWDAATGRILSTSAD